MVHRSSKKIQAFVRRPAQLPADIPALLALLLALALVGCDSPRKSGDAGEAGADGGPGVSAAIHPELRGMRTWRSADGNYSVEAELVARDASTLQLRRADTGLVIELELEELSPDDMRFVTAFDPKSMVETAPSIPIGQPPLPSAANPWDGAVDVALFPQPGEVLSPFEGLPASATSEDAAQAGAESDADDADAPQSTGEQLVAYVRDIEIGPEVLSGAAFYLALCGLVLCVLAYLILVVEAFKESWLWGFGCLLFPLLVLVFACYHWRRSRTGVAFGAIGVVMLVAATIYFIVQPGDAGPVGGSGGETASTTHGVADVSPLFSRTT